MLSPCCHHPVTAPELSPQPRDTCSAGRRDRDIQQHLLTLPLSSCSVSSDPPSPQRQIRVPGVPAGPEGVWHRRLFPGARGDAAGRCQDPQGWKGAPSTPRPAQGPPGTPFPAQHQPRQPRREGGAARLSWGSASLVLGHCHPLPWDTVTPCPGALPALSWGTVTPCPGTLPPSLSWGTASPVRGLCHPPCPAALSPPALGLCHPLSCGTATPVPQHGDTLTLLPGKGSSFAVLPVPGQGPGRPGCAVPWRSGRPCPCQPRSGGAWVSTPG